MYPGTPIAFLVNKSTVQKYVGEKTKGYINVWNGCIPDVYKLYKFDSLKIYTNKSYLFVLDSRKTRLKNINWKRIVDGWWDVRAEDVQVRSVLYVDSSNRSSLPSRARANNLCIFISYLYIGVYTDNILWKRLNRNSKNAN